MNKTEIQKHEPNAMQVLKDNVLTGTLDRIKALTADNALHLPKDYSPGNALQFAWLKLLEIKDKDKKSVLTSCTPASIMYAMLNMVVLGLNPSKEQCYFIPYGRKLACQPSYFGKMALAKRADPQIDRIVAQVVFEGDDFKFTFHNGIYFISQHERSLESLDAENPVIVAAYCIMHTKNNLVRYTEIMTYRQIKLAWTMSKMNVIDDKTGDTKSHTTHAKHPEEMCKKTVVGRACKYIINSSDDSNLLEAMRDSTRVLAQGESEEAEDEHANGEIIDIEPEQLTQNVEVHDKTEEALFEAGENSDETED